MSDTSPRTVNYPLPSDALRPQWTNARARLLAAMAVLSALLAVATRTPFGLADLDDVTLHIVFPAALGFVLAFAPMPKTRVGRKARDFTVLGLCVGTFAGDYLPVMLACYPLVLMISVAIVWLRSAGGGGA